MNPDGAITEDVDLGDYSLVDLSAWYTMAAPQGLSEDGTLHFQLAIKNALDEKYYGAGFTTLRIPLGTPRTVFASVSFDF